MAEPSDSIQVSCKLASRIESANDYIEDPDSKLVRNMQGQLIRQKLQVTLSYSSGSNAQNANFKNVQLSVVYPEHTIYAEQNIFRYDTLSFDGRSTPEKIQVQLYPTNSCEPTSRKVKLYLTYQQNKENQFTTLGGA